MIKFSLIICTYQRSKALLKLLKSIEQQSVYPNQIIIVDGSINEETKVVIAENSINSV